MSFLSNFLLAVGVSMDLFAVAMSRSTTIRSFRVKDALKCTVFGGISDFNAVIGLAWWIHNKKLCFCLWSMDCF
jgi:putative Mn2+ efflux pump MntP